MDQFKAHVEQTTAEQVEWMKSEFHLPSIPLFIKIADVPTGPVGQARRLVKSGEFAGFRILIQSYHYLREEIQAFVEYASYNDLPEIGGFETNDWRIAVESIVAHELSHITQFALKDAGSRHPLFIDRGDRSLFFEGLGRYESGHGDFFRKIYRRFRRQFINHRVPASAFTNPKKEFVEGDLFETRMKVKTGQHPLVGIKFDFKGQQFEIAGLNPRNARLYGYMVKNSNGTLLRCKLSFLFNYSPEVRSIVSQSRELLEEFKKLEEAQHKKKVANAKSSLTKKIRSNYRRMAATSCV
jgi:hypothetical protein